MIVMKGKGAQVSRHHQEKEENDIDAAEFQDAGDDGQSKDRIGDHVATVLTNLPRNIDAEMMKLVERLEACEGKIKCSAVVG